MGWAIGSLVGFALVTALVIALARSNTARWEQDRRAARVAARTRARLSVHARAAALLAQHGTDGAHRPSHAHVPHLHLPHIPHVHLPARVVDRLPRLHGRPTLHLPHVTVHLPHVDGRVVRRLAHRPVRRRDPVPEQPDRADEDPTES